MTTLLWPLRRVSDAVNRAAIAACAVLLALMLVISALSVALELGLAAAETAGRAGLFEEGGLAWLYRNTRPSLFRLLLPWFAMLSITVAFKYGEHIAILSFQRTLPNSVLKIARLVCYLAIACFAAGLLWYGVSFFIGATNIYVLSDTFQVSHRWTAAAVPVAGAVLVLHLADGLELLEERGVLALDDPADEGAVGISIGSGADDGAVARSAGGEQGGDFASPVLGVRR